MRIRRANVKISFQSHRYRLKNSSAIPTMVPTVIPSFVNTSIPTQASMNISISPTDLAHNSERKLNVEELNENRQLDTTSLSLQLCLLKYELKQIKIVKVIQQITVPLPYNVSSAEFSLLLESLLSNQNYIKSINDWARYYDVPIYLNVSTPMCGYATIISEQSKAPTIGPSSHPTAICSWPSRS